MTIPKLAIFKGFPFRYRDVSRSTDNALEVVQFIGGDLYTVLENSKGPEPVRIQAAFLGPLAATEKALFRELAMTPGPGTLIHPDLGVMTACLSSADVSSNGAVSNVFLMDLEFLPIVDIPGTEIAFAAVVNAAGLAAMAAAAIRLDASASTAATGGTTSAALAVANQAAASAASAAVDLATATSQTKASIAAIQIEGALNSELSSVWQNFAATLDTTEAAHFALSSISGLWSAAVAKQAIDYSSGVAETNFYEYLAAVFSSRLAALTISKDYDTFDSASAAATSMYETIRAVILRMADNGAIRQMIKMNHAAYSGLIAESLELPRRVTYENKTLTSSLELSFRLYGDISRADDIDRDNPAVVHPGFIGPGDLSVLRS